MVEAGTADRPEVPALARRAVETFVTESREIEAPEDEMLERAACFVTIRTRERELRGCIGTIEPRDATLGQEIINNAIGSATHDPRFPPVKRDELPNLVYSVDVLMPPEPASLEDLDPKIFGVIVEDEHGIRRGLLLPDIEGVETVDHQVSIAARKAGIEFGAPIRLSRFRVLRFRER